MSQPVVVAGGGPAGAAAALWLARAGRRVRLYERETAPAHKVCGEFLSWEAQAWLADLGIDALALGAVTIDRVRLVAGDREASAPIGFRALSLTRRRLDAALLEAAARAGVEVRRGVVVRALEPDGTLVTTHGTERPDVLVVATGKHGLRGGVRPRAPEPARVGLKTYLRLRPDQERELAGHVELVLFDGGYLGLQAVEGGAANLCLLVSAERFRAAGGRFAALLAWLAEHAPHLRRRLDGARHLLERPLAVSGMPYGHLWRGHAGRWAHLYPVGDQAAVIPSFAGDGVALALHGARLVARAILDGTGPGAYATALARDVGPPLRRATWFDRLMCGPARRQVTFGGLLRWLPGLLTWGARATRLDSDALQALGAPGPTRRQVRLA
ncbi:MAG: FAD-dependent monooxygenase [Sphingomonadaceae bacterium]|uniref:FAD-dependent monooxygenase n=1 Tax=Thermaurantiacus sp. TaxID=2820283 RepID=UPI00298F0DA6|nr:FAD-dependent monooxygenase [Thermaurantiacus sp.]MCS6986576.1 FAD-dependent monooxygenase [Sphingomonadaceae bacterium]MDW8414163.1 FAD-dependent monooxygenase [Thermaurantiacus sp.]